MLHDTKAPGDECASPRTWTPAESECVSRSACERRCDEVLANLPLQMMAAIVLASRIDDLEEDTALGRPDLEVEVSQEVHSYQSVDVLMPEREHREREIGCRYAEYSELSHVKPVAVLLADRGVNPGLLVAVSLGVTDSADYLGHQRGRSCAGVHHESCFGRSYGAGDLRIDNDQLAFTSEGSRESRHR